MKQFEKVVSSQHASLEYEVNLRTAEHADGVEETLRESAKESLGADHERISGDESVDLRTLVTLMGEQKKQLESERRLLREEIDKLKLIDKNKNEVIFNLRKEIDNCQPLGALQADAADECRRLRDECSRRAAENEALEEQARVLRTQLEQLQANEAARERTETQVGRDLDEYRERSEQLQFQVDQLNVTLAEKEELLKSNCRIFVKYVKTFSSYVGERNEIIGSALFGNEAANSAIDTLRGRDMTCSIVFDDDADANANIVSDCSDYALQLKDEFLELKESLDRMINATVASFEKLVTLTEVINRKDELLEEVNQEKDTLRREFQDAMESGRKEIDLLKNRYEDLNKASFFFFFIFP